MDPIDKLFFSSAIQPPSKRPSTKRSAHTKEKHEKSVGNDEVSASDTESSTSETTQSPDENAPLPPAAFFRDEGSDGRVHHLMTDDEKALHVNATSLQKFQEQLSTDSALRAQVPAKNSARTIASLSHGRPLQAPSTSRPQRRCKRLSAKHHQKNTIPNRRFKRLSPKDCPKDAILNQAFVKTPRFTSN